MRYSYKQSNALFICTAICLFYSSSFNQGIFFLTTDEYNTPAVWVDKYSDALFRFAYLRLNNREVARDLVQDTFLSALNNKDSLQGTEVKAWLYSILRNKIIDYYRKKKTLSLSDFERDDDDDFFDSRGHWKPEAIAADWEQDPAASQLQSEFMRILKSCLGKLSETMRAVFVMKYIDETESDIICKELGVSSSNYWVTMHRAKLQLRGCVEKNYSR